MELSRLALGQRALDELAHFVAELNRLCRKAGFQHLHTMRAFRKMLMSSSDQPTASAV